MHSPGIDKWIQDAPESWAKLAKKGKKTSFEQFKKKFFEGAELENKDYLKKYITEEQLRHIYTKGYGGTIKTTTTIITPTKPTKITIQRKGKEYTKTITPRWGNQTTYVLKLAAQSKPLSQERKKYVEILINQGRTKQAVNKKIQRTRKQMEKIDVKQKQKHN